MNKPEILLFTTSYLPGYKAGGILRTIVNAVDQLKDAFSFKIVTIDRDLGDEEPYKGIATETWTKVGNAQVYYLKGYDCSNSKIGKVIRETHFDILHLNSFFDPVFTIKILFMLWLHPKRTYPVILAPRGELNTTQLGFKSLKKRTYIRLMRLLQLNRNVFYQASDKQEAVDIEHVLKIPAARIRVAQDLPKIGLRIDEGMYQPKNEVTRIIFLSRISKEKNLKYAIEILQKVNVRVDFDIYGPVEDEAYWQQCANEMKQLPGHIFAKYCGVLKPGAVDEVMQQYDLFFLPTFSENYGHAIVDALLNGLPVLISNGTPWRALAEKGLGWDIDLKNRHAFALTIEQFSYIDTQQRIKDRHTRRLAFGRNFTSSVQDNIDLYHSLLSK